MLRVNNISFRYTKKKLVLDSFHFTLQQGEHLCVMGESGCGKSTLLKAIYGLENLDSGSIFWKEEQVLGPDFQLVPGFKRFKYVAQDFDLMPYTSVAENIKKFLSRFYPEESEARTQELLQVIELEHLATEKVKNLSGGQQQRVAIARALAKEPELILLDEPFSQIDNFKKNNLRRKVFSYLKDKKIACIVATHDKHDALSFADKLMVIKDHKILANNSPFEIYNNPKEKYIAALFEDVNEIEIEGVKRLLYPHQIKIVEHSENKATVINSFFKGDFWLIAIEFHNQVLYCKHPLLLENKKIVSLNFKL